MVKHDNPHSIAPNRAHFNHPCIVHPAEVLPHKRYGLAVIATTAAAHVESNKTLRTAAWTTHTGQTPAHSTLHAPRTAAARVHFVVSDAPETFQRVGKRFLGERVQDIELVALGEPSDR